MHCNTQTCHSSPSIPRDSAPRLWGRDLSPTSPHPPQLAADPFFPYLFPDSSPGFLRGRCPSHLPAWPHFPRLRLLPDSASPKWLRPSRGRQGAGRPASFRLVFPCGVPSDPLWNIFLPAPSLGFHLRIPSAQPHLSASAPPRILSFPISLSFSFISVPSPITLSQASVYSAPCSLPLSPSLPIAPPTFPTPPSLSKTLPIALSLTALIP